MFLFAAGRRSLYLLAIAATLLASGCVAGLGDFQTGGAGSEAGLADAGDDRSAGHPEGGSSLCSVGAKECSGLNLRVCSSKGTWQVEATCPFLCVSGACVGICKPGDKKCEDNMTSTCSAGGEWGPSVPCTTV